MSIPWPVSSQQDAVTQLATVVATFLSPAAVLVLSKNACCLVSTLRDKTQCQHRVCSLGEEGQSQGKRAPRQQASDTDLDRVLATLREGPSLRRDGSKGLTHHQEDRGEPRFVQVGLWDSGVYCTCGSSTDTLSWKQDGEGGGEDCGERPLMEPDRSERGPAHQEGTRTDFLPNNRARYPVIFPLYQSSSDQVRSPPNKAGHFSNNTQFQIMHPSLAKLMYGPSLMYPGQAKHHNTPPQGHLLGDERYTLEKGPPVRKERPDTRRSANSKDLTNNLQVPSPFKYQPDNSLNPASRAVTTAERTDTEKAATDPNLEVEEMINHQSENLKNQKSSSSYRQEVPGLPRREDVQSLKETEERVLQNESREIHAQQGRPQGQIPSSDEDISSGVAASRNPPRRDTRKRYSDEYQKSPPAASENMIRENLAEPHEVFSRSSSCESYSTAPCSCASSPNHLSPERQDERNTEPRNMRQSTTRPSGQSHRGPDPANQSDTAPSAPRETVRTPSVCQGTVSCQTMNRRYETCDTYATSGESQEEDMETIPMSQWVMSTLKSWLPGFLWFRDTQQRLPGQDVQRHLSDDRFQEFDVRNVLGPSEQNPWKLLETEAKPCPHSCASSLCNFRHTLESWRQQLLAMPDVVDASAVALPSDGCAFCHEDCHCAGHINCHTMQVAQQVWRMVLELKRSHLESSTSQCPHANSLKERTPNKQSQSEEADQCYLGHRHSCTHDYIGCSQQQFTSPSSQNANEALCVHALLYDLDRLLGKFEQLKKSSNMSAAVADKSQCGAKFSLDGHMKDSHADLGENLSTSTNRCSLKNPSANDTSPAKSPTRSFQGLTKSVPTDRDVVCDNERHSAEKSTASLSSPSSSASSTEEVAELKKFFLGNAETATDQTSDDGLPPQTTLSGNVLQSTQQDCTPECDQLATRKARTLGKFAIRYLEHIETCLKSADVSSSTSSQNDDFRNPIYKGNSSQASLPDVPISPSYKPMLVPHKRESSTRLHDLQTSQETLVLRERNMSQDVPWYDQTPESRTHSVRSLTRSEDDEDKQSTGEIKEEDTLTAKGNHSARSDEKQNVIAVFEDIIADLNKIKQKGPFAMRKPEPSPACEAQPRNSAKSVKFAQPLPIRRRIHSLTRLSARSEGSPLVPSAAVSSSSCSSLATRSDSSVNVLSMTQAFDKLDKVVDDLLQIMDVPAVSSG